MIVLNLLRMMADLSFYSIFAGTVAVCFEKQAGRAVFAEVLLLSLCFGISAGLWKRGAQGVIRIIAICPAVLSLLIPGAGIVGLIFFIPPAIYVCYTAGTGNYGLSRYRQMELFSAFCKAFPIFGVFMLILGWPHAVLSITIPMALLMAACSVVLMRTLRLEPEFYLEKGYQLRNLAAVGTVIAISGVLSTELIRKSIWFLIKSFYDLAVTPILMLAGFGMGHVMMGFWKLVGWILSKIGVNGKILEQIMGNMQSSQQILQAQENMQAGNSIFLQILIAIGVLAASAAVILFFIRLSRKIKEDPHETYRNETRMDHEGEEASSAPVRNGSAIYGVRRQYRKFLKLYTEKGAKLYPSNTSLDVEKNAERTLGKGQNQEELTQLRAIYIKARYHGEASREDVAWAKKLYRIIRKNAK